MNPPNPNRIIRYSAGTRINHWIVAISFVLLALSGLALFHPALFWLTNLFGGGPWTRILHPFIGCVMAAAFYLLCVKFWRDNYLQPRDWIWLRKINDVIGNREENLPDVGRYNGGQKLLFWGFFFCGILLFLSGLVLWFPHWIPWNLRFLRLLAVIVHPATALITIGLFIIHVYMGTAMERGAFGSVIRGDISAKWAQRYHGVWYEEITRDSANRK